MRPRTFLALTIAQGRILRRNVTFWLVSIFVAIFSMVIFGTLFNPGREAFDLGFVNEDQTPASASLQAAFESLESLNFHSGGAEDELAELEDGEREAVVIAPAGFADQIASGRATVELYYDESNPIEVGYVTTTVEGVVQAYNEEVLGQTNAVSVERLTLDTTSTRYVDFLTPGMVGMTIMFTNLAVGFLIVNWREMGILRRLGVTPLRPGVLIVSQAASFSLISVVQVTILLLLATFVFGVEMRGSVIFLALSGLLGVFSMLSIGYVIASFARSAASFSVLQQLVSLPMLFLGGSYFPLDAPSFLVPVVQALPLTHLNEALRDIVNRGEPASELWMDWLVLAVWAVGGYALSMRLFRWG